MAKKRKKLIPMGKLTDKMETVLQEMTDPDKHAMQWHEVLALVHQWLQVHAPHAQETYIDDNSNPIFYYGPRRK